MRTKLNRKGKRFFAPTLAASIALAITFIFSCSSDLEMPKPPEDYGTSPSSSTANIGSSSSFGGSSSSGFGSSSSLSSSSTVQNSSSSVASSSSGASSSSSSSSSGGVSSSSSTTQSNSSSSVIDVGSCDGFDPNAKVEHYGKMKKQICDERDGKRYVYVKIGTQTWMAENLNYAAEGSKCYTDNNPDETANCKKYGRLYNWAAAMGLPSIYNSTFYESEAKHRGICPSGWHIPSNEDWDKLFSFVDGNTGTGNPYNSPTAGRHLKAISGWHDCDPSGGYNNDHFCEDTHGFSALPGGEGNSGYFSNINTYGRWLSSSEGGNDYAYHRYMNWSAEYTDWSYGSKSFLLSVRCVED